MQIKKIYKNYYFTKYICWNKNFENKNVPFVVINKNIISEENFNDKCDLCNQVYFREFLEKNDGNGNLIFKCPNDNCDEFNYEYLYDLKNKDWKKRDILSKCEFQYLHWYLYRKPAKNEFNIINSYLEENEFKLITENLEKETIDYRKFFKENTSIHFKLSVKPWGFGISCHKDVEIHTKVKFDNQTLKILSGLYLKLKEEKSGKCFMLPREHLEYAHFLLHKYNYKN